MPRVAWVQVWLRLCGVGAKSGPAVSVSVFLQSSKSVVIFSFSSLSSLPHSTHDTPKHITFLLKTSIISDGDQLSGLISFSINVISPLGACLLEVLPRLISTLLVPMTEPSGKISLPHSDPSSATW